MQCVNNADYSLKCICSYYIVYSKRKKNPNDLDMISTTKNNVSSFNETKLTCYSRSESG